MYGCIVYMSAHGYEYRKKLVKISSARANFYCHHMEVDGWRTLYVYFNLCVFGQFMRQTVYMFVWIVCAVYDRIECFCAMLPLRRIENTIKMSALFVCEQKG